MTQHDPQVLVKMAKQIVKNIPDRNQIARATSEHIKTFWAPSIVTTLTDFSHKYPKEVSADVRGAIAQLAQ